MKQIIYIYILLQVFVPAVTFCSAAANSEIHYTQTNKPLLTDSAANDFIQLFLHDPKKLATLKFPGISKRFYENRHFKYAWFGKESNTQTLYSALSMLQNVLQYGLNQNDFYRQQLNQMNIRSLLTGSAEERVVGETDIILTDAIINLIVQLRYGAANPYLFYEKLDKDISRVFSVHMLLSKALLGDFEMAIHNVQPQNLGYKNLQNFMRLAVLNYIDKPYDDTLRLVALNLERYRWQNLDDSVYVEINIPSYTLQFFRYKVIDTFRVIVGSSKNPTPTLTSHITFFETAPDWNVPSRIFSRELLPKMVRDPDYVKRNNFAIYNKNGQYIEPSSTNLKRIRTNPSAYYARQSYGCDNALGQIVFRFDNPYGVYLHDTPERSLFNARYRALSHGCIRLQNPRRFAYLLLEERNAPRPIFKKVDDAMDRYQKFRYAFTPIPIVIRYLTCSVQAGRLLIYQDIYNRDTKLSEQLFGAKK